MVDLKASNAKLRDRAARIVSMLTDLPREQAFAALDNADGHVKLAVVMVKRNVAKEEAQALLAAARGRLRDVIG